MSKPSKERSLSRRLLSLALKLLLSLLLTLTFVELGIRLIGLDDRAMLRSLYYQDSNSFVYEPVSEGSIRYQPVPGDYSEQCDTCGHAGDMERPWTIHINSHNARGAERSLERPPGVFRVLFVGGSTIFGHGVNDHETLPVYLEQALQRALGDRPVEVWNYGRQAYVLRQSVELAERLRPVLEPDLILIHDCNKGRRPFLPDTVQAWAAADGQDPGPWLGGQEELVLENWEVPKAYRGIHVLGMRYSALWRTIAATLRLSGDGQASVYGDARSCATFRPLREQWDAEGQDWALVTVPDAFPRCAYDDRNFLDLNLPGADRTYFGEAHPPPETLQEWAESLTTMIVERDLVAPPRASDPE